MKFNISLFFTVKPRSLHIWAVTPGRQYIATAEEEGMFTYLNDIGEECTIPAKDVYRGGFAGRVKR